MIFYPLKPVANRTVFDPSAPHPVLAVPVAVAGNNISVHWLTND
jgi:hypothetical protein